MDLRGKKIACFLALPHHTRFFIPISEQIERQGGEVIFIVPLSDYPYDLDLIQRNLSFRYFTDYLTQDVKQRVDEATRTLLKQWSEVCYQWDGFSRWPVFKQSWFFEAVIEEYFCMERFIEVEKPDMFLAHHECTRWGKVIGYLAHQSAIPYVTFQEGDYYGDQGAFLIHTEYSTADLLWGEATIKWLANYRCSKEKMIPIGNTHIDRAIQMANDLDTVNGIKKELHIPVDKKVVLFLVDIKYGGITNRDAWSQLLQGLDQLDGEAICLFKWHPNVYPSAYKQIQEIFLELYPSATLLSSYDPYKLIAISDYCVTLGKTSLAVEAIAFGKPLFALPTSDTLEDYYVKMGIAQTASPPGNWSNLFETMRKGVPPPVQETVDKYLKEYFYKLDGNAVERAIGVMNYIFETRRLAHRRKGVQLQKTVTGRVSFIVPSGNDAESLLATLTSLSQNVNYSDWEVIIVVNDESINKLLSGISGDVRIVEAAGNDLPFLFNRGAEVSSGEHLIFLKPGVVYFKGGRVLDSIRNAVVGMPIRNPDMTPYCLGLSFDFNFTPYKRTAEDSHQIPPEGEPRFAGGGFIGIDRRVFEVVGGFDEAVADQFAEVDICLSARDKGFEVNYASDGLAFVVKETFEPSSGGAGGDSDDAWKKRISFFAKWCGKLPKNEDFIAFAGNLLKV